MTPRWAWSFTPDQVGRPSPVFNAQYDAEEWLGGHWRDLADQGITEARLLRDGAPTTPVVPLPAR